MHENKPPRNKNQAMRLPPVGPRRLGHLSQRPAWFKTGKEYNRKEGKKIDE
jgi:2-keto-3-deoxy-L-rhamnonate aldolase RhmA